MPTTLITRTLPTGAIETELQAIPGLLKAHAMDSIIVWFGYGTFGHAEELWKEHTITVDELPAFAAEGVRRGLFEPGESDLYIKSADGGTTFTFCHEADIHLKSDDATLLNAVAARWDALGHGFSRTEEKPPRERKSEPH